jgi:hypothetical protein
VKAEKARPLAQDVIDITPEAKALAETDSDTDSDEHMPINIRYRLQQNTAQKSKPDILTSIRKSETGAVIAHFIDMVKKHALTGIKLEHMSPADFRSCAQQLLKLAEETGEIDNVPFAMSKEYVIAELRKLVNESPENTTGLYSGQDSEGVRYFGYHIQVDLVKDEMYKSVPYAEAYHQYCVMTTNPFQALMAGLPGPGDWMSTTALPDLYKQLRRKSESFANTVHLVEVKGVKPEGELVVKDGSQLRFRIYIEKAPNSKQFHPLELSIEPDWPEILAIIVMILQFSLPKHGIGIERAWEAAIDAHTAKNHSINSQTRGDDNTEELQQRASQHKAHVDALGQKTFACAHVATLIELVYTWWEKSDMSLKTDYSGVQVHVKRLLNHVQKGDGIEAALGTFINEWDLAELGYTAANIKALTSIAGLFGLLPFVRYDPGCVSANSTMVKKLKPRQLGLNVNGAYAKVATPFLETVREGVGEDFGRHEGEEPELDDTAVPELDDTAVAHSLMQEDPMNVIAFWMMQNQSRQDKRLANAALALMGPVSFPLHYLIAVERLIQHLLLKYQIPPSFMLTMLRCAKTFVCSNNKSVEEVMKDAAKQYGRSDNGTPDLVEKIDRVFKDVITPLEDKLAKDTPAKLLWDALKKMNAKAPQRNHFARVQYYQLWELWHRFDDEGFNADLMVLLREELKDTFPLDNFKTIKLPNNILQHYFVALMVSEFVGDSPILSLVLPSVQVVLLLRDTD